MKKTFNWIIGILLLVSLIFNCIGFYYYSHPASPEVIYLTDTITIPHDSIITKIKWKTKFDTIIDVQFKDSIIHDTVRLPIEHKVDSFTLHKDSLTVTEKIHHSGFHSNIDSVEFSYNLHYTVQPVKPKNFGWCLTVGPSISYGVNLNTTTKQFDYGPSLGVSIVVGPSWIIK